MSRSQGAANSGWPPQRYPAAEPDPRTGGHPAQRPQATQQAPQYAAPQQPSAPSYPPQQGYPQQAYADPQGRQQPAYAPQPQASHQQQVRQPQAHPQQQPAYHYPAQQAAPQPQYAPQQHVPQSAVPRTAPPTQPSRQALSSLDSARNAQPTHEIEGFPRTQPPQYARAQQQQPAPAPVQRAQYAAPQAAPQYAAPRAPAQAPVQGYDAWPAQHAEHDPYAQPAADYFQADAGYAANSNQSPFDTLQQADWSMPGAGYDDPLSDPQGYGHAQLGYDQAHGNALEPTYNQNDAGYEVEEPRRASWTMRIAGAVVVAIGLGYGLAQAYKSLVGPAPDGAPPVIASDASPAKEKPLDPGGRQFSHTDSKVLGRLGEEESHAGGLALSETEDSSANGARQVKTLVVGRDGSIAPPSAPAEPDTPVSVPGLTVVDAFGADSRPAPQRVAATEPVRQPDPEPAAAPPPPRSGVNVKTTRVIPSSTASLRDDEAPAAAPPKKQKVAATDASSSSSAATGANGYVVVLASVPASSTSRLDALRKFADMQQQYGPVLGNKTPDVRETTLAGKGPYHRLLVGPPGSRTQANELCTQLKAYGYKDCWVTAY